MYKNKILKASSFYVLGNIFDKAIVFLTIPFFTRVMSQNDYGIVNTYLSFVSILTVIVGLSLGSTIRNAYIDYKLDIKNYITSIFQLSSLFFLLIFPLIILFINYFYANINLLFVFFCLIQSYMIFIQNSINTLFMMRFDYIKKMLLMSLPNIFITIFSVVLLLMFKENKYYLRILSYVIVNSIVGGYFYFKYFNKKIIKKYWKYAISLSFPLIFHGLSTTVLSSSDRIMITLYRSATETSIYSLIYSLSMISLIFKASLESIWIPWFSDKIYKNMIDEINSVVKKYIDIILSSMICLLLISPEILHIMAPKEYWGGLNLIPIIISSSFFMFLYSISVNLEYYYKSTKVIAQNTIIISILNVLLNMIFIPKYGALAAAFTTLISYITSFTIHYIMARKLDSRLFDFKIYIIPITLMVVAVFMFYNFNENILIRWIITVCIFLRFVYKLIYTFKFN